MGKKRRKKRGDSTGRDLFNQVISLTGIPANNIKQELKRVLDKKNIEISNLTLDQLRRAAASYLREIMGGLLDKAK